MAYPNGNENRNEAGRPDPVIRDNRRIDPVTGGVRQPGQDQPEHEQARPVDETHAAGPAAAPSKDAEAGAPAADGEREEIRPVGEAHGSEGVQDESADIREDLQRLQAEYINYRRRVDRDRAVAGEVAVRGLLTSLLPVLDDIDAARAHGDLAQGPFASIAAKLEGILASHGLERIDATAVEFDPGIHQALARQQGEGIEVDTVQQVLRAGYRAQGRVLRPAHVIVAVP